MKQVRVAFSGSGFLAGIHAGAICALMDSGIEIVEVAGTSGGSIAASLVACGFSAASIKQISLEDLPGGILSFNPFSIFRQGINSGNVLRNWLHQVLGEVTFEKAAVPITIMATNINERKSYRMAKDSTPITLLADACRASASVPFVFEPYDLNGVKCCDGGMCCNLALDQLVMDGIPQIGIEVMDGLPTGGTSSYLSFAKAAIQTMLQSNEENLVAWGKMFDAKIIQVDATPYGFLDPSLPPESKEDLFNRGYQAVMKAI